MPGPALEEMPTDDTIMAIAAMTTIRNVSCLSLFIISPFGI